jgi:serine/threonine protein kinase
MNPERWERVKQLVGEAMTLEARERESFVDRLSQADSELQREVRSLLSFHDQAGTEFLSQSASNLKHWTNAAPARAHRQRIGPYEITEEIGRGGMGEVYRAVRADGQYTKEVAIKLVQGGSGALLERFRNERQILASLDHPNIARLHDGGSTENGVPYLVMELIEGTRIDEYCEQHRLSVNERLQLFLHVCDAVQFRPSAPDHSSRPQAWKYSGNRGRGAETVGFRYRQNFGRGTGGRSGRIHSDPVSPFNSAIREPRTSQRPTDHNCE